MKKVKIALLVLFATVFILPACKKGPDDPFLSLRSRRDRLCSGKWSLSSGTKIDSYVGGITTTYTYNGTLCTESGTYFNGTYSYTETYAFSKNGTYEYDLNNGNISITNKGNWYFGRRNSNLDLKARESVVLVITSSLSQGGSQTNTYTTYTGADCPTSTIILDELKDKEIKIKCDGSEASPTETITGTLTYQH